ncbi:MAG: hypothetical protein JW955_16035 [Sedimentisphaerales bacterium]|nr:hypothetical protein [Sedimentisphaerales bacterium]
MRKYVLLAAVVLVFSTTAWGYGINATYTNTWMQAWLQTHAGIHTLPWPSSTQYPSMWPAQWPGYNPCGCTNPCPCPCGNQNPCQSPCGNIAWLWLMSDDCTPGCGCGCDCDCDCDCCGQTSYNPCVLWGIGCH